eukprot:scaffold58843_cov28-Attheya_sp.AAC.1
MLFIHEKENEGFNHVNYATTMSQLGHNRYVDHQDPFFRAFLDDLGNQVEVRGLRWLQWKDMLENLPSRAICRILQTLFGPVPHFQLGVESPNLFSQ